MSSTLILHVDKNRTTITPDALSGLVGRPETETHKPIGHSVVRDMLADQIGSLGLEITNEQIGVTTLSKVDTPDGEIEVYDKAFGTMDLMGADYCIDAGASVGLSVGWRNSLNKQLPVTVTVGSRVFVCDNLCLSGELYLKRRHTKNVMDDLPWMIARAFGQIAEMASRQFMVYDRLRDVKISDDVAAAIVVEACRASGSAFLARKNVVPILETYQHELATDAEREAGIEYNRDQHGYGTAWSLWNAGTAFAKNMTNRNFVDATPPLLDWNRTFTRRFAADLAPSSKAMVTITATDRDDEAAAPESPEAPAEAVAVLAAPEVETVQATPEIAPVAPIDAMYDPADEDDIIGLDDSEWEVAD